MTTKTFTIQPIQISVADFDKVKEFKFKYIDYIMLNGVFYNVTGFVSFCLNAMLKNFNEPNEVTFDIGGFEARSADLEAFRTHGATFLNVLKAKGIDEVVYLHVEDVLNRTIDALEQMTIEAREARAIAAETQ